MNLSHNGLNFNSFTNANQILEKGEKVTMDKQKLVNEHKKLVDVLDSESHEDDEKESKEQAAELKELEKGKKSPVGTVSNGYKKIADGKWQKVTEHGLTHSETKERMKKPITKQEGDSHVAALKKIDDKEYDDAHVMNSKNLEKGKKGLWENVHEKRKSGEEPAKPGDEDYPETEAFEEASKSYVKKSDSDVLNSSVSKDMLVKSHIGYQFSNSENLAIEKKGSEIKERLIAIKSKELTEAAGHQAKMEALLATIPNQPTDKIESYIADGMDVNSLPNVFNWGETYCNTDSCVKVSETPILTESTVNETPAKSAEQIICDSKREYNRCAEKFVQGQVEVKLIDTMINNLIDTKTYKLVVKQAAILGF